MSSRPNSAQPLLQLLLAASLGFAIASGCSALLRTEKVPHRHSSSDSLSGRWAFDFDRSRAMCLQLAGIEDPNMDLPGKLETWLVLQNRILQLREDGRFVIQAHLDLREGFGHFRHVGEWELRGGVLTLVDRTTLREQFGRPSELATTWSQRFLVLDGMLLYIFDGPPAGVAVYVPSPLEEPR